MKKTTDRIRAAIRNEMPMSELTDKEFARLQRIVFAAAVQKVEKEIGKKCAPSTLTRH